MVLGVTGPFASGKSLLASYFRKRGFRVIDVDSVGHAVLKRGTVRAALRKVFGPRVLLADGNVDRTLLGRFVFNDPWMLKKLDSIVHPVMRDDIRRSIGRGKADILIDAALLFEMNLDRLCDRVILVTAPLKMILARGKRRNGFDASRIRSIIRSQLPAAVKRRKADLVIRNNSTQSDFKAKAARAWLTLVPGKARR